MAFTLILSSILNLNFWLDFILIFYVYNSKFYIIYAVSFIYSNLSPHCFPFSFLQGKFFLSKDNGLFSPSPPSMIVFSMVFIGFLIAHECDHLFVFLLPSEIKSQVFIFSPSGVWQGWQRMTRRPPRTRMKNGPPFIIGRSSSGGGLRGGEFHKCSDIYTTPPPPPQNGRAKKIIGGC